MTTTPDEVTSSAWIDAPVERVWKAVTTPSEIKQWFFGVETESDWRIGGDLIHRGEYRGKPYVDKGTILGFEPPRRMVHTHWSDVSGKPDTPDNYQQVAWDLADHDGGTQVTITERNLPSDEARQTSEQAWKAALAGLKEMLER